MKTIITYFARLRFKTGKPYLFLLLFLLLTGVSACGGPGQEAENGNNNEQSMTNEENAGDTDSATSPENQPASVDVIIDDDLKHVTTQPESWEDGPDVTIELVAVAGLIYDTELITVEAGSRVAFTLINDDGMLHNVVITKPQTASSVGQQAMSLGLDGDALDYVPQVDDVLYYSTLIEYGETQTIYFEVPEIPGDYEFVCTFPGHYLTMRGILRVE